MHMNNWHPTADITVLQARAEMLHNIRVFFAERNVWEVDTPVLSKFGVSDPHINSLPVHYLSTDVTDFNASHYLMSSPEYAMKRLLAAGSGSIYQIAKAFRDGETGRKHNPEFTLLEWYRIGFDLPQLMQEVASLLDRLLSPSTIKNDWQYLTYAQAFTQTLGFDPISISDQQLAAQARTLIDCAWPDDTPRDTWLDLLMSHKVEPALPNSCMVYDYPPSQAALAQIVTNEEGVQVARRFEVYINGIELANGYQELTDAKEQQARFAMDNAMRQQLGKKPMLADTRLLDALEQGMPECAGVALGLDRLLMLEHNKSTIAEVMAFDFDSA